MKTIDTNLFKFLTLILVIVGLESCSDDFLEVTPRGVLVSETTQDYDLLLNARNLPENSFTGETSILRSFEVVALEPFLSQRYPAESAERNNFEWEPGIVNINLEGTIQDWFIGYTNALYYYNKIINEVQSSSGGSQAEKDDIMAEAMATRASWYFEWINLYGQPYNAVDSSTDPGVPLITDNEVNIPSFTRASVQEIYDFIITDLTTAIPLMTKIGVGERIRMSRGAAKALLAKVYVYMGRYNDAIPLFDEALLDFQEGTETRLYDYNQSTLPGGVHFDNPVVVPYIFPTENTENPFFRGISNFNTFVNAVLISPEVSSLYSPSDLRLNYFASRNINGFPFTPPFPVPDVYVNRGGLFENRGIKLADVYLLRAESKARTNDLAGAIEDLEFLRRHRMASEDVAVPTGLSQDELVRFVFDERTREFAVKGELWYDMRRLWDDALFQDMKPYEHVLYGEDGSVRETYTLDEKRLVLRFSERVMSENPDMVNNPL